MGWTSGDGGRRKVVAEYNRPETNHAGVKIIPVKHKAVGDEDWFITRYERPDGTSRLEIWVMIWEGDAHKEIPESSYPYASGCPIAWLDEVPEASAEWRAAIRARHATISVGAQRLLDALSPFVVPK
jgi:hypothetical protein